MCFYFFRRVPMTEIPSHPIIISICQIRRSWTLRTFFSSSLPFAQTDFLFLALNCENPSHKLTRNFNRGVNERENSSHKLTRNFNLGVNKREQPIPAFPLHKMSSLTHGSPITPTDANVLCGRGKRCSNHPGNISLRN